EAALAINPDEPGVRAWLVHSCNSRARQLASGLGGDGGLDRAWTLSRRAMVLSPGERDSLSTLGVVHYRAGRYAEAIPILERSLEPGRSHLDGFDLFFLAMAHHRVGHRGEARGYFDRGVRRLGEHNELDEHHARELAAFRAEAEAVLAGPARELPDD